MNPYYRTLCKTIAGVMLMNCAYSNAAFAQSSEDQILNAVKCHATNHNTGVTVPATCGMKVDDRSEGDGRVHPFRTFTDPATGIIHEEYKYKGGRIHHWNVQPKVATITDASPVSDTVSANIDYQAPEQKKGMSTGMKALIVGGAVIGTAVVAVGLHKLIKAGRTSEAQREKIRDEAFARGVRAQMASRPEVMANAPTRITLDSTIPHAGGQQATVSGGVPASQVPANVPRYTTSAGQPYFVQTNPNTGLLETILIMDMLERPYYYPGAYAYNSFMPPVYNETVVVNNTDFYTSSSSFDYLNTSNATVVDNSFSADTSNAWDSSTSSSIDTSSSSSWDSGSSSSWDSGSSSFDSGSSSWDSGSSSFDSGSSSFDSGSGGW